MKRAFIALLMLIPAAALAELAVILPDPERFAEGRPDFLVETTIPGHFKTLEGIVLALLTQGDQRANKKLSWPFSPSTIESVNPGIKAKPLAATFRGARKAGRNVVLSFDQEAMRYLNSTAAIQQNVKGSIEATIRLHFPGTKDIQYEVDGKIVTGWDA